MPQRSSLLLAASVLICLILTDAALAQDLHSSRRLSPVGIAKTHLGDTYVKVIYGRPYVRGRKIFGTDTNEQTFLVPFGELWRTGANEATEISTTGALEIAGHRVEAGTYAIFTEPDETEWTIHVSPQLGLDGTGRLGPDGFTPDIFDKSKNVLTFSVSSGSMTETVDQFTITFDTEGDDTSLVLRWENTEVRIPVRALS